MNKLRRQYQVLATVVAPVVAAIAVIPTQTQIVVSNYQFQYQALAHVPLTVPVQPFVSNDTSLVAREHQLQYQATTPLFPTGEVVSVDKWFAGFSEPTRRRISILTGGEAASPFVPFLRLEQFPVGWSGPPPRISQFQYQTTARPIIFSVPEVITTDKWFAQLSLPVRVKPRLQEGLQQTVAFFPTPVVSFGWFAELSKHPGSKTSVRTGAQQFLAFVKADPFPETVTESRWHQAWSEPVRLKPRLREGLQQTFTFHSNPTVSFGWFGNLSEPVREKIGLRASLQRDFTIDPYALTQPEAVLESKWHQAWSEPVRFKQGLRVQYQRDLTQPEFTPPEVTGVDKWFAQLSEPKRFKLFLRTGANPSEFLVQAAPFGETIFEDKWHYAWSEPIVKAKQGLRPSLQQFLALVQAAPFGETIYEDRWHFAWSEPVRIKPYLLTGTQQFVQHVISPITLYLQATETPDQMAALLDAVSSLTGCEVSIIEIVPQFGEVSSFIQRNTFCDVTIVELRPELANVSSTYVNRSYADVAIVEVSS